MLIELKGVGLAAYAKLHGATIVSYNKPKRHFVFESDVSANEWMVDYFNSCCSKHDAELCNLRKLQN